MTFLPSVSEPGAHVARGIVAVAHSARLIRTPHGRRGDEDALVSVVDDGGEPWVLAPPWERPAPGPARLRIVAGQGHDGAGGAVPGPDAAVVLLAGRLEARTVATVSSLPTELHEALERHRSCFDLRTWPALAVARFVVASIGVAIPPAPGAVPRALEPVPLADYAACEPDLWRIQQAALLAHLGDRHGAAMLAMARRAGAPDADIAVPRAVDAEGLTLVAIGPDGVRDVHVPFPQPLSSPSDVGPALFGP
jgi:hypothetical protein